MERKDFVLIGILLIILVGIFSSVLVQRVGDDTNLSTGSLIGKGDNDWKFHIKDNI